MKASKSKAINNPIIYKYTNGGRKVNNHSIHVISSFYFKIKGVKEIILTRKS